MSRLFISAFAAILFVTVALIAAQDTGRGESVMEKKLARAQSVLAGVATQDFDRVSTDAHALLELARQQWTENETPEYRAQLKDFWIALEGMESNAEEESIDALTLSYVQMTLSCVKCHKYLRETRRSE
jgi:hypothetical protein